MLPLSVATVDSGLGRSAAGSEGSAASHSASASVESGGTAGTPTHFVEAMGSIESGNERTHKMLETLLTRMDQLEAIVARTGISSVLAALPNEPIDPNYRNHALADHESKYDRYLPMGSDEMVFLFEKALQDSALEAGSTGIPDRVCFFKPVSVIEIFTSSV